MSNGLSTIPIDTNEKYMEIICREIIERPIIFILNGLSVCGGVVQCDMTLDCQVNEISTEDSELERCFCFFLSCFFVCFFFHVFFSVCFFKFFNSF